MPKNWKLKSEVPAEIAAKISVDSKLIAQLLYNRGLTDENQIKKFLEPKYEDLHNPFLFKEMSKAVDRIWQAIEKKQSICIYGDYDADAVTANAVLQQTFKYLGVDVESYIPDRFTEGYGINIEALEKIRDGGCKLIITVDCGTNSTDAADFCNQNNIDLIITDHHEIIGDLPKAFALINPKNSNDNYPYSEITGVGVAFKLACGILSDNDSVLKYLSFRVQPRNPLNQEKGIPPLPQMHSVSRDDKTATQKYIEGYEKWLLDLVAIGTVADCHELVDENRIFVKFGLKVLQKTRWPGLRAMIASTELDFNKQPADTYTLGFVLAPRLNAAGRLEHANIALYLLMEQDPVAAQQKAVALNEINRRRQDLTQRVLSEAREQALKYQDRKVLVLLGQDWPKGVVGLVAGKIAEEYYKPTIVLSAAGVEATGSARTVGDFNVIEALKSAADFLVRFGGHKQAAGLTLKTSEYDNFYKKILDYADEHQSEFGERQLNLDAELVGSQLSIVNCQLLQQLEPFGVGNPRPKFFVQDLKIISTRLVGSLQQHLQLQLEIDKNQIPAIYFNCGAFAKNLKVGDNIDVAAELIEDGWNGQAQLKLKIIDIRNHEISN